MSTLIKETSSVDHFFQPIQDDLYREAMMYLVRHHPGANWEITRYPDRQGRLVYPYLKTESGYFVEVTITVNEVRRSHLQPVLTEDGQVIFEGATAEEIQFAIEDCFIVCVGLHGIDPFITNERTQPVSDHKEVTSGNSIIVSAEPSSHVSEVHSSKEQSPNEQQLPQLHSYHYNELPTEPPPENHVDEETFKRNVYKFIDVSAHEGDKGPYYTLVLSSGSVTCDVTIHGELMKVFEDSWMEPGEKCEVTMKKLRTPAKGELLVAESFTKVA